MIQRKFILLLVILSLSSSANAATRYVSDNLYTYMHTGAGTKYKIMGSVSAGEKIQSIQRQDGFTKIKDSRGRIGWINSKYVSNQAGVKERLAKLDVRFTKLNKQLDADKDKADRDIASLKAKIKSQSTQIVELKNVKIKLNKELKQVKVHNETLSEQVDTKKNDLLMRWFSYGAIVAGIGLFIGLILPSLIPSKKRSRW